jgi:hypothetical protein
MYFLRAFLYHKLVYKERREYVRGTISFGTNKYYIHRLLHCILYNQKSSHIDDIFMTWNRSKRDLIKLLDEANTWHPNIKLDYKIGQSLPFLDILLTNNNGILITSVYHKPAAEPYVVPFLSDHPRHVFVNIIQNSLKHALTYSSTFEVFNKERRHIQLMLLYNG